MRHLLPKNAGLRLLPILAAPLLAPRPGYPQGAAPPPQTWTITRNAPATASARPITPRFGEGEVLLEAGGKIEGTVGEQMVATGGVTLTQEMARLTAEKMTLDQRSGEVVAEGDVVYTEPGRTVRAQRLVYNIDTRRVQGEGAETVNQGVILRGREIAGDPTRLTVADATVT